MPRIFARRLRVVVENRLRAPRGEAPSSRLDRLRPPTPTGERVEDRELAEGPSRDRASGASCWSRS